MTESKIMRGMREAVGFAKDAAKVVVDKGNDLVDKGEELLEGGVKATKEKLTELVEDGQGFISGAVETVKEKADGLMGQAYPTVDMSEVIIKAYPTIDGGGYRTTFPDYPGCVGDGDTQQQALENGLKAVAAYREVESKK